MNKSFTLIEILVVIVVIGIISSFIIVGLSSVSDKANIVKGQAFSNSLRNSLLMNLVSEWKLDEGAGVIINDKWGVHNGTLTNGEWKNDSECINDNCLYFDGDDYINTNLSFSINNYVEKNGLAFAAWVKTSSNTTQSVISQDSNSGCTYSCAGGLYIMNNKATAIIYSGSSYQYISSLSNVNDNKWHYLVASFNNDHKVKIFFDGKEENSQTVSDYANYNPIGITIGYLKEISRNYNNLIGCIDEILVFNEAIDESRVELEYYSTIQKMMNKQKISINDYLVRISQLKLTIDFD